MSTASPLLERARRPVQRRMPPAGSNSCHQLTVIERKPGWRIIDLVELWRYRELLFFLTWRDIKVRYKHTMLGAAWAVLQPFGIMLVMYVFLRRLAAPPEARESYPLFVFAGLLPWTFFANSISTASQSVVGSQNLITKIYFPRLIIPMGAVGAHIVDFLVGFGMLLGMMCFYGVTPGLSILWLPLIVLGLVMAALGVGALLAALTVAYRDFRYMLPFLIQLWLFATPSSYVQVTVVGWRGQALLPLNPAYGLIRNFRLALTGGSLDWRSLALSGGVSVLLLLVGCQYFRQVERDFADII